MKREKKEYRKNEETGEKRIWYDNVMLDEIIQRHAYNNNSNTSQLKTRQDKAREDMMKYT